MKRAVTRIVVVAGLALFGASLSAQAGVFRCVDPSTKRITFSDTPCTGSEAGGYVDVRPNTLDTSGSREQAMRHEIQQLREEVRSYREEAAAPRYGRTQSDLQAERIDSLACEQAKRSYDLEAGSVKRDKAAIEAKRSAMYGACGMREPDRTEINVRNVPGGQTRRIRGPSTITSCDSTGCWDSNGTRYNRGAGSTYFGPNGACQMINGAMHCP